jgi:hypothetical protein
MTTAITTTKAIDEFRKAFNEGLQGIVRACEIYVEAIDDDPRNAEKFKDEFENCIPVRAWSKFEAVGRKWLHPNLLMGGMVDRRKTNMVKRLPYSMQERIFNHERFPFLCVDGDTLQIDITEATPEQVEQLCDGSVIRSISAQRAFIESKKVAESDGKPDVMPYTISGGRVTIRRLATFTRAELKRILQEM